MNDFTLILSSLKSRWLNASLSVLLTAFGVMLALIIIQFGQHVQNRLKADGKGIDIVIGTKGSPMQLILSSVYHIDIPTGNIPYDQAKKWMAHPHIKTAIPLALGDNWRGYRIIGTTPEYVSHYNATLQDGHLWHHSFDAIAGAMVGLKTGDTFSGAHGLIDGGHVHNDQHYKITGVLKPTGTVLDRLILTSVNSVLNIHGLSDIDNAPHNHDDHEHHHDEPEHNDHGHSHNDHDDHADSFQDPEITALLLTTKSPIANINLPRQINRDTALQAANPALEMARLTAMLGLGSQSLNALSALLIIIAALSIFAGLAASLENRLSDLAILRALGYSRYRLAYIMMIEAMIIVVLGLVLGCLMGLCGFFILSQIIPPLSASGAMITLSPNIILVIIGVLGAGLFAAILPAIRAAKVDVAKQLSHNG